ncbi:protein kinase domain-containing protein [Streptomyces sp. 4N509B]|uniref:protein kinase domain-containing protein n=1 Tax=Streptomyces sp. 4N509B TaxID=3457413 RepID=UPI003FD59911
MRRGDVIGGYLVVSEPTNADGGKCVWAFATREGREFFLKRFLEPKRPRAGSARAGSGSAAARRSHDIRMALCHEFEERHRAIMARLRPDATGAGNLVLATDFFCEGSTYYKVTERIDTASLAEPQSLDPKSRAVLLRTLMTSLRLLHDIDVVHGDLKPANVLVQKRPGQRFHSAKLIDFDDSYVAGHPPGRTEIAGDSVYGAPEWRRYVQGDETVSGRDLTTAVDVFALGLMTHLYLTGSLPGHDARYGSPADAVNAGEPLAVYAYLGTPAQALIAAMTAREPERRPTVDAVLAAVTEELCTLHDTPQPAPTPAPTPAPVPVPAPVPSERSDDGGTAEASPGAGDRSGEPADEPSAGPDGEAEPADEPGVERRRSRVRFSGAGGAGAARRGATPPTPATSPSPPSPPSPPTPEPPRTSRVRFGGADRPRAGDR